MTAGGGPKAYSPGVDAISAKYAAKRGVEDAGGRLPAEHGHGKEYTAPDDTQQRWRKMDPSNAMNPGVGGLALGKNYRSNS